MFEKRRKKYLGKTRDAVTILLGAKEKLKSGDVFYRFRQDSDFYYLTGFDEPDAVAVLAPNNPDHKFIMFVRPKDETAEQWTGYRYGVDAARKKFGADIAYRVSQLDEELPRYFDGHDRIIHRLGYDNAFDRKLVTWMESLRSKYRAGKRVPLELVDPSVILHEMRVTKTREEIDRMIKAQTISARAFGAIMKAVKPGMFESELETMLESYFRRDGGMGSGYATIVASHENGTILHYTGNSRQICDGDLVLVDAGAEYDYYSADISRTFPANGKFSGIQRDVYSIVLEAQMAAIEAVHPGNSVEHIHRKALKVLVKGLISLKVVDGPLNTALKKKDYRQFYMHGTSHYLGMDVHDVGMIKQHNQWRSLKPGMVLTVEPGLYFSSQIKGLPKKIRGIAVRIEDNILVTRNGYRNLTPPIPKTIAEIEKFMS